MLVLTLTEWTLFTVLVVVVVTQLAVPWVLGGPMFPAIRHRVRKLDAELREVALNEDIKRLEMELAERKRRLEETK